MKSFIGVVSNVLWLGMLGFGLVYTGLGWYLNDPSKMGRGCLIVGMACFGLLVSNYEEWR